MIIQSSAYSQSSILMRQKTRALAKRVATDSTAAHTTTVRGPLSSSTWLASLMLGNTWLSWKEYRIKKLRPATLKQGAQRQVRTKVQTRIPSRVRSNKKRIEREEAITVLLRLCSRPHRASHLTPLHLCLRSALQLLTATASASNVTPNSC